ncbi:MAG: hypothetical protein GXY32_11025 [Ruminococcaceae bacterium]|nr:hypothetical protein [Oscillospiraceae bacterium]
MALVEIERKWLMDGFPEQSYDKEYTTEQGYLAFGQAVVRIRRYVDEPAKDCILTIKGGGTLMRTEVETTLTPDQYEALLPLLAAPSARKKTRLYPLPGGLMLECSLVDEGEPTAFYYAEVEFASIEAAQAFVAPPWLGREVTEEPGHSMAAYCQRKAGLAGEVSE